MKKLFAIVCICFLCAYTATVSEGTPFLKDVPQSGNVRTLEKPADSSRTPLPPPPLDAGGQGKESPEVKGRVNGTVVISSKGSRFFVKNGDSFRGCSVRYPYLECVPFTAISDDSSDRISKVEKRVKLIERQLRELRKQ